MSEDNNWELYRKDLDSQLASNVPSIPFLGVFLTQVVQQESYNVMKSKENIPDKRKPSVYETYSILDAITVRNTLEKMNHQVITAASLPLSFPTWSDSDEESPRDSPEVQINPKSLFPRPQRSSPLRNSTVESIDGLGSPEVQINPKSHLPTCGPQRSSPLQDGTVEPRDGLGSSEVQIYPERCLARLQRSSALQNGAIEPRDRGSPEVQINPESHVWYRPQTVRPTSVFQVGLRTGRYQVAGQTPAAQPHPAERSREQCVVESSSSRRERLRKLDSLDLEASVAHYIPKLVHNPVPPIIATETSTSRPSDSANEKRDSLSRSRSVEDLQKAFHERDITSQLTIPHFSIQQVGGSSGSTSSTEDSIPGLPYSETPLTGLDSRQALTIHLTPRKRSPFPRRRRATPVVPSQMHPKTPNELLQRFQFLSFGCTSVKSRPELRTLLTKHPHNTEAQNYKLSCEIEPHVFKRSTHTI